MKFGIYPGGRAGRTCARESSPERVASLVADLAGGRAFAVREYVHFLGAVPDPETVAAIGAGKELDGLMLPDEWYRRDGRELDLVVSYLPAEADLDGWLEFLDRVLERYGHLLRYLQVTLEPNFPIPLIDGSSPGVLAALTTGLPYAKRRLSERGIDGVRVGFSVAEPAEWLGGDAAFWEELGKDPSFAAAVDYVGLGLYPDAFGPPVPLEGVRAMTGHALSHLRHHSLAVAGIPPSTPLHIAENGSPSLPGRDQVGSLDAMLSVIREREEELNIALYELFALRDADTGGGEAVGALGLLTDDYEPKPAYGWYREVVRGLA